MKRYARIAGDIRKNKVESFTLSQKKKGAPVLKRKIKIRYPFGESEKGGGGASKQNSPPPNRGEKGDEPEIFV